MSNTTLPYWTSTITVCNKLSAKDNPDKVDKWYTTVLTDCFFKITLGQSANGTDVKKTRQAVCRIPKNAAYKPYDDWVSNPDSGFTLSTGDYIFLGRLKTTITAENIVMLYNQHKNTAMVSTCVKDNSDFCGLIEHYRAEGV